ncbi:uncharacterized protein KZ484_015607 isoform 2-T2 [Pholidichthys leucotaenia]
MFWKSNGKKKKGLCGCLRSDTKDDDDEHADVELTHQSLGSSRGLANDTSPRHSSRWSALEQKDELESEKQRFNEMETFYKQKLDVARSALKQKDEELQSEKLRFNDMETVYKQKLEAERHQKEADLRTRSDYQHRQRSLKEDLKSLQQRFHDMETFYKRKLEAGRLQKEADMMTRSDQEHRQSSSLKQKDGELKSLKQRINDMQTWYEQKLNEERSVLEKKDEELKSEKQKFNEMETIYKQQLDAERSVLEKKEDELESEKQRFSAMETFYEQKLGTERLQKESDVKSRCDQEHRQRLSLTRVYEDKLDEQRSALEQKDQELKSVTLRLMETENYYKKKLDLEKSAQKQKDEELEQQRSALKKKDEELKSEKQRSLKQKELKSLQQRLDDMEMSHKQKLGEQRSVLMKKDEELESERQRLTEMETSYKEKLDLEKSVLKKKNEELESEKRRFKDMETFYEQQLEAERRQKEADVRTTSDQEHRQRLSLKREYEAKFSDQRSALEQKDKELKSVRLRLAEMETSYKEKLDLEKSVLKKKNEELESVKQRFKDMETFYEQQLEAERRQKEADVRTTSDQEHRQRLSLKREYEAEFSDLRSALEQKDKELKSVRLRLTEMETSFENKLHLEKSLKQKELKSLQQRLDDMEMSHKQKLGEQRSVLMKKDEELESERQRFKDMETFYEQQLDAERRQKEADVRTTSDQEHRQRLSLKREYEAKFSDQRSALEQKDKELKSVRLRLTEMETSYKEKLDLEKSVLKKKNELESEKRRFKDMETFYEQQLEAERRQKEADVRTTSDQEHRQRLSLKREYDAKFSDQRSALEQKDKELKSVRLRLTEMETSYKEKLDLEKSVLKKKNEELESEKRRLKNMETFYEKQLDVERRQKEADVRTTSDQEHRQRSALEQKDKELKSVRLRLTEMETSYKEKLDLEKSVLKKKNEELESVKQRFKDMETFYEQQLEAERRQKEADVRTTSDQEHRQRLSQKREYEAKFSDQRSALEQKDKELKSVRLRLTEMETSFENKLHLEKSALKQKDGELEQQRSALKQKDEELQHKVTETETFYKQELKRERSALKQKDQELKTEKQRFSDMETFYKRKLEEARSALKKKDEELKSFKNRMAGGISGSVMRNSRELQHNLDDMIMAANSVDSKKLDSTLSAEKARLQQDLNNMKAALKQKDEELRSFKDRLAEEVSATIKTGATESLNSPVSKSRLREMYERFKLLQWPKIKDQLRACKMSPKETKTLIQQTFREAAAEMQRKKEQIEVFDQMDSSSGQTPQKVKEYRLLTIQNLQMSLYHSKALIKTSHPEPEAQDSQDVQEKLRALLSECYWMGSLMALNNPPLRPDWENHVPSMNPWDMLPSGLTMVNDVRGSITRGRRTSTEDQLQEKLSKMSAALKQKDEELRSFKDRLAEGVSASIKTGTTESLNSPVSKSRLREMYEQFKLLQWPKVKDQLRACKMSPKETKTLIQQTFREAAAEMQRKKEQIEVFDQMESSSGQTPQKVQEYRLLTIQNLQMSLYHSKDLIKTSHPEPEAGYSQDDMEKLRSLLSECYWMGSLMALNNPPLQPDWENHIPTMNPWDMLPSGLKAFSVM